MTKRQWDIDSPSLVSTLKTKQNITALSTRQRLLQKRQLHLDCAQILLSKNTLSKLFWPIVKTSWLWSKYLCIFTFFLVLLLAAPSTGWPVGGSVHLEDWCYTQKHSSKSTLPFYGFKIAIPALQKLRLKCVPSSLANSTCIVFKNFSSKEMLSGLPFDYYEGWLSKQASWSKLLFTTHMTALHIEITYAHVNNSFSPPFHSL